jgi:acyl-CoA synthetase (AMP-forming)/AMP-acid ligase II
MGEIACRGDVEMSGYWNNPARSVEALRAGWFHTGDMGVVDQLDYLTLSDRGKDVAICGGSNTFPREVVVAIVAPESEPVLREQLGGTRSAD